jgi:UDP-N-acetyl-2-amino-2-deoxyglucuronate dehydrogenase
MARRGVAIIGLGMAATPHARSLADLGERIEVRAAWSRSAERRAAFAASFPFPLTDDLEAILADPAIELVLVLTPPDARDPLVPRLAAAGKHVLMEKPIERTTAAAERIVAACERAGVSAAVMLQHRFRPASQRLAALLAEGALGELAAVQLIVPWWRPQSYYDVPGRGTLERDGGGVLLTQAVHALDLMLALAGPVTEVAALAGTTAMHRMPTEDFCGAGLRFANGALGGLIATTAAYPGTPERLVLTGTRAGAVLEAGTPTLSRLDGSEERFGEPAATGGGADPMAFPHDWHRSLIEDVLDALDAGRQPRASARSSLAVHHLIDALLRSSAERRVVAPAS